MKKCIVIMRHAQAENAKTANGDHERVLTPYGREQTRVAGQWLKDKNIKPDVVLCSTATRTRETLDGIIRASGAAPSVTHTKQIYSGSPADLFALLQNEKDATVMMVGHNPAIHALARTLAQNGDDNLREKLAASYEPCTLSVFEIDDDSYTLIDLFTAVPASH